MRAIYGAAVDLRSLQAGCQAYSETATALNALKIIAQRRPLLVRVKATSVADNDLGEDDEITALLLGAVRESALPRIPTEVIELIEDWAMLIEIEDVDLEEIATWGEITAEHAVRRHDERR